MTKAKAVDNTVPIKPKLPTDCRQNWLNPDHTTVYMNAFESEDTFVGRVGWMSLSEAQEATNNEPERTRWTLR